MRVAKGFVGLALVLALCVSLAPTQAFATYGMGNYYCTETVTVPGHYTSTKVWSFVASVGGGYAGAAAVAPAAAVAAAGYWVVNEVMTWVPASTYCAHWEYSTRMDGNSYQH